MSLGFAIQSGMRRPGFSLRTETSMPWPNVLYFLSKTRVLGIEYGIMQSVGEGFGLLQKSPYNLDLLKVAKLYQKGTLVSGFMMQRTIDALEKDPKLSQIEGYIEESGEGRWTVEQAKREKVSVPIIEESLMYRAKSRQDSKVSSTFAAKLVAALRQAFGGHEVKKK